MGNSNLIYAEIEKIAQTASKNEKQELVRALSLDEEARRVMEYAYNPFKVFGIAKRPELIGNGGIHEFDADTWEVLDDLISRKITGNTAIEHVRGEMSALTPESAELFWRIITKDLRAGFSESTVNKAVKGLIPEFPYMRCTLPKDAKLDEFDWTLGVFSQEKADGMFANVNHEVDGRVTITSRQGTPFPVEQFASLETQVHEALLLGTQSHGELLVRKAGVICAREIGNGILNGIAKGGVFEADEEPVFQIWDQIPLSCVVPKGKCDTPYVKRLASIMRQLGGVKRSAVELIETRVYHSLKDAYGHYRELLLKKKEGTIIKNPHAVWRDGTSKEQVKLKLEVDVDLKVKGVVPGKDGTKNEGRAGSLACESSCGLLKVDVTVKNESMRDRIDGNKSEWIDKIIVVRANSVMYPSDSNDSHSLFLPRMVETDYRIDKAEADSLQRIFDQFESAVRVA